MHFLHGAIIGARDVAFNTQFYISHISVLIAFFHNRKAHMLNRRLLEVHGQRSREWTLKPHRDLCQ